MKMKPLLVYHSATPRVLKGYSKNLLLIIRKYNKRAWIPRANFTDWFTLHAVPTWKEYSVKENIPLKILLVIGNVPAHPVNLGDLCDNVKVVFLPPNTTSLLQPMDYGAMKAFMSYYLRTTFIQLIKATDGDDKP